MYSWLHPRVCMVMLGSHKRHLAVNVVFYIVEMRRLRRNRLFIGLSCTVCLSYMELAEELNWHHFHILVYATNTASPDTSGNPTAQLLKSNEKKHTSRSVWPITKKIPHGVSRMVTYTMRFRHPIQWFRKVYRWPFLPVRKCSIHQRNRVLSNNSIKFYSSSSTQKHTRSQHVHLQPPSRRPFDSSHPPICHGSQLLCRSLE